MPAGVLHFVKARIPGTLCTIISKYILKTEHTSVNYKKTLTTCRYEWNNLIVITYCHLDNWVHLHVPSLDSRIQIWNIGWKLMDSWHLHTKEWQHQSCVFLIPLHSESTRICQIVSSVKDNYCYHGFISYYKSLSRRIISCRFYSVNVFTRPKWLH